MEKILKKAWINLEGLTEEQRKCFLEHYKNNENVYILTSKGNLEYKIIDIKNNIMNLEFTNKGVI